MFGSQLYHHSNVVTLKWMIAEDPYVVLQYSEYFGTSHCPHGGMVGNPVLVEADPNTEHASVIDINRNELPEPVLALPNDPETFHPHDW